MQAVNFLLMLDYHESSIRIKGTEIAHYKILLSQSNTLKLTGQIYLLG
jgi:hypothetical protein